MTDKVELEDITDDSLESPKEETLHVSDFETKLVSIAIQKIGQFLMN